ncbi:MAG: hypothetical protein M1118_06745 [Chloroflexi bacterium]|nr:hypothetical protein [Chloroflexota bacterium]
MAEQCRVNRRRVLRCAAASVGGLVLGPLLAACRGPSGPPKPAKKPVTLLWSTWGDSTNPKDNPGFQNKNLKAFLPPMTDGYGRVQELFRYDDQARTVLNSAYSQSVTLNQTTVQQAFSAAAEQIDRIEAQLNSGGPTSSTKQAAVLPCTYAAS